MADPTASRGGQGGAERSPGELDREARDLRARCAALELEKEAYRQSADLYRDVVEEQTELICRRRPNGVLRYVNPAYCRYFDSRCEALIGTRFEPDVVVEDRDRYRRRFTRLSPESPTAGMEIKIRTPGGDERRLRFQDVGIFAESGELVEVQSVGRDVTDELHEVDRELRAAERQIARDHEALGRFAAAIAHDFNNLLVGILGNAGLALMDLSPYSSCRPLIQEVEKAALRAAELSNRMLAYSGHLAPESILEPVAEPKPSWRGDGTILVVDDEETVRTLARRILEKFGFKVMTAEDGRQALEIFRAHADDLRAVLLDVTMPELDGEATFRQLHSIRPDAKVILSSGYAEQEATRRIAGEGLAGFLHKPYLPQELIGKIREIVES